MKHLFLAFIGFLLLASSFEAEAAKPTRAQRIVSELKNPKSDYVLVAAHRGDWRNWPENSLQGIQSAIDMGVDIIELDLKMTKDSVLVVCHDSKVDRTTTGKGHVKDMTYDSIQTFWLRAGHGVKTGLKMPTLREALALCKDKAVVNIDKGYEYYNEALAICEELGVTDQILIKGYALPTETKAKFAQYPRNMLYMPIVDFNRKDGRPIYNGYKEMGVVPLAYELCWSKRAPEVDATMKEMLDQGAKLWVNSLWPSLNGGLCDDAAMLGNPEEIYGKILADGATIIQTDRPVLLLDYLRSKGRHD